MKHVQLIWNSPTRPDERDLCGLDNRQHASGLATLAVDDQADFASLCDACRRVIARLYRALGGADEAPIQISLELVGAPQRLA